MSLPAFDSSFNGISFFVSLFTLGFYAFYTFLIVRIMKKVNILEQKKDEN